MDHFPVPLGAQSSPCLGICLCESYPKALGFFGFSVALMLKDLFSLWGCYLGSLSSSALLCANEQVVMASSQLINSSSTSDLILMYSISPRAQHLSMVPDVVASLYF